MHGKVWDVESGQELRTLTGHSGEVRNVALSADGRRAVSASGDHTLKVWNVESGACIATFTCDSRPPCCAFADSETVIAGDAGAGSTFFPLNLRAWIIRPESVRRKIFCVQLAIAWK
ncbi:WD40 repeat domain-containing protein [Tunturiibacter psychrotolerans]|uniref:WD40 repeat domain-containing protein n=1 Tax=Tunturiibacter psychrotolerans TaxID=3069686 RepID=UPI0033412827